MDLVEQFHNFGLANIHTFGPIVSLIRLFSLMLNYAKPRLLHYWFYSFCEITKKLAMNCGLHKFSTGLSLLWNIITVENEKELSFDFRQFYLNIIFNKPSSYIGNIRVFNHGVSC